MRKLVVLLAAALAGCQNYQSAPLDLRAHNGEWAKRDPASPGVVNYAHQLSAARASGHMPKFDASDGLDLGEAEVVALFFNPRLRAARLKARVPAVGAAEAGRWDDPVLRVDAERIIQAVENPWVLGGLVELTLPLSGRPALQRQLALADADAALATALLEEHHILSELARDWAELALLNQRIDITRSYIKDLDEITIQAERLRAAGELTPIEAGLFKLELARQKAELQSLEPLQVEREIVVKAVLGLVPTAPIKLSPSLIFPTTDTGSLERRVWIESTHPRLQLARAEYVRAERNLELEIRKQYPDLTLGGGYGRDEGTNRILGGLSIPIPLLNANRKGIAEARAHRDAARADAQATYEEVIASLARAEAMLRSSKIRRDVLERDLAPLADQQLQAARKLGQLGNVNTVVVFEALTRAHETRVELLEAAGREASAQIQINALLRPALGIEPQIKEKP